MAKCIVISAFVLLCTTVLARPDDIVDIANSGEPGTLDPHLYFTNLEEHILKDLFVGLTTMNAHGEIIPGCATSWSVSEDKLAWTFKLREGLVWSDGKRLVANDFVFGIHRLLSPDTGAALAFFLYSIKHAKAVNAGELPMSKLGVSAPDHDTLVIELEEPNPFLAERLLYPIAYPVPRHAIEQHGGAWIKPGNWVSNGPFKLNTWRPQEYVELVKNPSFYAAEDVRVSTIRYYPVVESVTGYNRYLANELDVINNYPKGVHEELVQNRNAEIRNAPLQSIMYLVFNTEVEPFNDIRIRQALALAIDRQIIIERILGMGELPSTTLSPPIVANYQAVTYPTDRDLVLARKLLQEAGYAEGELSLELRHIADNETKNVYVAIASMWREIGVETTLHHAPLNDHFSNLNQGNFEVAQAGWFGENNPEHYIELLSSKISAANYGKYHSETFDKLLASAKRTGDIPTRIALLNEAETVALRDYPVIPLYVVNTRNLVTPNLKGWFLNGRNLHPARYFYWE